MNLVKDFVVNKAVDVVSFREAVNFSTFVLQGAPIGAIRDSCVQVQRAAGHDVNVIASGFQIQIPFGCGVHSRANDSLAPNDEGRVAFARD